jgi:intein-encoded DNA endonuclease-like protein
MDEVITGIMEMERQCSTDVEQAEAEYSKKIEEHKHILEEKKTKEHAQIISAESTRLTQAIEKTKREIEAVSAAFRRDSESRLQDPVLNEAIKEDIISILLKS